MSSTSTDICVFKNYVDAKLKELQWIQKKELFQKRVISKNTDFDVHTATVIWTERTPEFTVEGRSVYHPLKYRVQHGRVTVINRMLAVSSIISERASLTFQ